MTVRTRLALSFALVAVLLLIPGLYAGSRIARLRDIAVDQQGRHAVASLALGRIQASLADLDRFQRSYLVTPDTSTRRAVDVTFRELRRQIGTLEGVGYGDVSAPLQRRIAGLEALDERMRVLVATGELRAASILFESMEALLNGSDAALDPVARAIDRRSGAAVEEARQIRTTATATTFAGIAAGLVLALVVAGWTTGALTGPLERLRAAMVGVEEGDLEAPEDLPYERDDEIGDVTRSFESMTRRLAELDRLKAEFLAVATHEMKTPINVITGYAALIEEEMESALTDHQRETLDGILEQTKTLTRLVNRLQEISRLEAGGFDLSFEEVIPGDLAEGIRRGFEIVAARREIDFSVRVDGGAPEYFWIDPDVFRDEVVGNLVSNALKYTDPGGEVDVRIAGDDDTARVEVVDTGPGIDAEHIPFLFDRYYRVKERARAVGSGLGLAIAREIAEQHGGSVTVESEPGVGSTFRVLLPPGPVARRGETFSEDDATVPRRSDDRRG